MNSENSVLSKPVFEESNFMKCFGGLGLDNESNFWGWTFSQVFLALENVSTLLPHKMGEILGPRHLLGRFAKDLIWLVK
jgi:hypothetical protein